MQAKLLDETRLGLYLHVPFCATTCDFCAFHQDAPSRETLDAYLEALEKEIELADCLGRVDTVFFGGGTPGLLSLKAFERILAALHQYTDYQPAEVTVEFAPSTVKPDKMRALRELGINRASLGVQSFDEGLLEKLGRRQSAKQARAAYEILRDAGFNNINIDLMFAYPGQSEKEWAQDLETAVSLQPEHISTYCLTFEEDTTLWVKLTQGDLNRSIDDEASRYRQAWDVLPAEGFLQYEVSNFAKAGFASKHNINTWQMGRWRGFGPGAASQYADFRFANPSDTPKWQESVLKTSCFLELPPWAVDKVALNNETLIQDSVAFGLRMNQGVSTATLRRRWPESMKVIDAMQHFLNELTQEGYAMCSDDCYVLTEEGRLRVDAIGAELITR